MKPALEQKKEDPARELRVLRTANSGPPDLEMFCCLGIPPEPPTR